MTISAKDGEGNTSAFSNSCLVTTPDNHPPTAPADLTPDHYAETSFTLTWKPAKDNVGVSGYDVYRDGNLFITVNDTVAEITGLSASTTYLMTVKAKDAAGNNSDPSVSLHATTPDTHAPSVPDGISHSGLTETGFTLSWNAATDNIGVTGYNIYKSGTFVMNVTSTTATLSGLTSATTYFMTIRATDAAGNISDASQVYSVETPDVTAPTIPTGLKALNLTETSFTLRWKSSRDNVAVKDYDIYKNDIFIATVTDTFAQITDLIVFTSYTMTIKSRDLAGNVSSTSSALVVVTPDLQSPTPPKNITSEYLSKTLVYLTWKASSDNVGVTEYEVYKDGLRIASVSDTEAIVSNVFSPAESTIYLTAKDAFGNTSPYSAALRIPSNSAALLDNSELNQDQSPPDLSLRVYPNPVQGSEFYINLGEYGTKQVSVKLIDCKGKIVYEQKTDGTGQILAINTSDLNNGIYFIKINLGYKELMQEIVINTY
jgi:chitodextrinase